MSILEHINSNFQQVANPYYVLTKWYLFQQDQQIRYSNYVNKNFIMYIISFYAQY